MYSTLRNTHLQKAVVSSVALWGMPRNITHTQPCPLHLPELLQKLQLNDCIFVGGLLRYTKTAEHQKIPGSNPGRDLTSCWPNGKASDYDCSFAFLACHTGPNVLLLEEAHFPRLVQGRVCSKHIHTLTVTFTHMVWLWYGYGTAIVG